MAKIFISYRRADSGPYAGRIYDRLATYFGHENVFKDVDNIRPGEDFGESIQESLKRCSVAVVIIGPRWLATQPAEREQGPDEVSDYVRIEIETAFELGLRIIPVLTDGATMPRSSQMPASLQRLSRIHAISVRDDPDFAHDVQRLIDAIEVSAERPPSSEPPGRSVRQRQRRPASVPRRPLVMTLALATLVVVVVVAGTLILSQTSLLRNLTHSASSPTAPPGAAEALYQQITGSPPSLSDSLSAPDDNGWDTGTAQPLGRCGYNAGAYSVSVSQTDTAAECYPRGLVYDNLAIQVTMTIVAGDAGGLIFRAGAASSPHYRFAVYRDDQYDLVLGNDADQPTGIAGGRSAFIRTNSGQDNVLTVIANGDSILLYINEHFIQSAVATQSAATTFGGIGFFAYDKSTTTDCTFSNLKVWAL